MTAPAAAVNSQTPIARAAAAQDQGSKQPRRARSSPAPSAEPRRTGGKKRRGKFERAGSTLGRAAVAIEKCRLLFSAAYAAALQDKDGVPKENLKRLADLGSALDMRVAFDKVGTALADLASAGYKMPDVRVRESFGAGDVVQIKPGRRKHWVGKGHMDLAEADHLRVTDARPGAGKASKDVFLALETNSGRTIYPVRASDVVRVRA